MPYRNLNRTWGTGRVLGTPTGGVKAELLPSSGEMGASYLYPTVSLPADTGKEICGLITAWPSAGTLRALENGAFTFADAPDGTYTFNCQRYVDLVASGDPVTVTLIVGPVTVEPAAGNLVMAGQVPGLFQPIGVTPATGRQVFAGASPGIAQPQVVVVGAGHLDLAGQAPTLTQTTSTGGGVTPADIAAIADAVWAHAIAIDLTTKLGLIEVILRNKMVTDPASGVLTIYDTDGVTPLLTAQLYEDVAGAQTYRGQGADRRERLQ